MSKRSNERYLQFPLSLLGAVFTDTRATMNRILMIGLYRYSQNVTYDKYKVSRQLIYDLYRGELSATIRDEIAALNSDVIGCDGDYSGFDGKTFAPEDEIEALKAAFDENDTLYAAAVEHYQMHQAYRFIGIEGNKANTITAGKQIDKDTPKGQPMPMISRTMIFDFRDNEKTEKDIAQLCAYIAIRSILGTKKYTLTNKELIVCRIFGYASKKHLPETLPPHQKDLFDKYATRYHMDKTLTKLRQNWGIDIYAKHIRGLYVSAGKISLNDLALEAERKKQKTKLAALKAKTDEAHKYALEQLKKEREK